jgi:hypothetical protein
MTNAHTDIFTTPNIRLHRNIIVSIDNAPTFGRDDLEIQRFNDTYIYCQD